MKSGLKFRPASSGDADAIAAIYAPIVRGTAISFETAPPTPDVMAERIAKTLPTHPWLVAPRRDRLAGYVYAGEHRPRAAYRWSVDVTAYVAEDARGQGVGKALYGVLFEVLRAQGFHSAFAGIALPNAASVALHENVGFQALGVYRDVGHKFGRWHDVGWWRLGLSDDEADPKEPVAFAVFRETEAFRQTLR